MKQKFASRKLLIGLGLVVISTIMIFTGNATFPQWADFMKWVFTIYVAGNSVSGIARVINGKK